MAKTAHKIPIPGFHAIEALCEDYPHMLLEIWHKPLSASARLKHIQTIATANGIAVHEVRPDTLEQITQSHQGIIAWARPPQVMDIKLLPQHITAKPSVIILVLAAILDPHNVGACLRSAEACGTDAVVLVGSTTPKTATVVKTSTGAVYRLPLFSAGMEQALAVFKSNAIETIATTMTAQTTLWDGEFSSRVAVIMGGEQQGIHESIIRKCDQQVSIPMAGKTASLNVSVASGVMLYELRRRQQQTLSD